MSHSVPLRHAEARHRSVPRPARPGPTTSDRDIRSSDVVRFAREISRTRDPEERLEHGVLLAAELVHGCDHAGVSVLTRGKPQAGPATDAVGRRADQLQHDLDEGPCLDAFRSSEHVTSQDLSRELRWRQWSPTVVDELGTRASLSLPLADETHVYGSLNLYSDRVEAWGAPTVVLAQVLATHLALALADALQIEHRGRAMASRTVIGQAQGILMERFDLSADAAYGVLLRISQQDQLKVATVAADLVRTGRLPTSRDRPAAPVVPSG